MTVNQEIKAILEKAIKPLSKEKLFFDLQAPEHKNFGDYSTNIALILASKIKKSPKEIAIEVKKNIKPDIFGKIEIAGPGFLNLFLSEKYLLKKLDQIIKEGEDFGFLDFGKGKKVQVEFVSANPTGPLTLGNARGGPYGDTLANILKKAGFQVEKAYYINDCGNQILALGHSVLKDSEAVYKGEYIDVVSQKIKEKDPYVAGQKAAGIIVKEMIKKTAKNLGIIYDQWLSEKEIAEKGFVEQALKIFEKKGYIYKKEGAVWFFSSKFGDERDRVLIKKDGLKTYLAGDSGLHKYKFEKKRFDKVINIWGADHYGDVAGLNAVIEALGHKDKLDIVLLQFVSLLKGGKVFKMSKRKGVYVTVDELLEEVGKDAFRFFFLAKSAGSHLNFDLDLAKEQSAKNPVYYVQYAHARICSIIRKAKIKNAPAKNLKIDTLHPSEKGLIKTLIFFPDIIKEISSPIFEKGVIKEYPVQKIAKYSYDLAESFHIFYRDCRIISEKNKKIRNFREALLFASKNILSQTLFLMGISAPKKM